MPKLKPSKWSTGCILTIDNCEGVPIPKEGANQINRSNIVHRVIRVGIFDETKKDFLFNTAHVKATWVSGAEDKWTFPDLDSLNPLLFRTTEQDERLILRENCSLIFELVIYIH